MAAVATVSGETTTTPAGEPEPGPTGAGSALFPGMALVSTLSIGTGLAAMLI